MALLQQFLIGEQIILPKLNAMVDKLNLVEPTFDIPAPLFQRRELDGFDWAGQDSQHRVWSYLIQHKQYNTHLHYHYDVDTPQTDTDVLIYIGTSTAYNMPTLDGSNVGSIDLRPLNIPNKRFYVVRFKADRMDANKIMLSMLYEKAGA